MDHFEYRKGELYAEEIPVAELAEKYGTPLYVYSRATLERHWHAFNDALGDRPHLVCYAMKANSNLAVLNLLARLGSGFDIVSGGELERVLRAGGTADKVVFSGVGKSKVELERALDAGVRCFNVESAAELERLEDVAKSQQKPAPISIRVNPDVDPKTHPYISTGLKENKFGVDIETAFAMYKKAAQSSHLHVEGIDYHIGSQVTETQPFVDALKRAVDLAKRLQNEGIHITHLNVGGGLGIRYKEEQPPSPAEWAASINAALGDFPCEVQLEPGRAIVGNAGILLTRVEYLKQNGDKNFAVVDAGMNDLLRPALYQAWQEIIPVKQSEAQQTIYDVVGPVCESSDFLGKDRPLAITRNDLLAVRSAGAYSFAMSSNYNSRPRAAEVLVDQDKAYLVRGRETIEQLMVGEHLLPA